MKEKLAKRAKNSDVVMTGILVPPLKVGRIDVECLEAIGRRWVTVGDVLGGEEPQWHELLSRKI
jgi:hypothetical protein